MLGLGGNISASAPTGVSGATQPPREQLVFTYDLANYNTTKGTVTIDESYGGYSGLLKLTDTVADEYFYLLLLDDFDYLEGDIFRLEYYIPSSNASVNSFPKIYSQFLLNQVNQNASDTTDQMLIDDIVIDSTASTASIYLYFTAYDSSVSQGTEEVTNDVVYIKSAKVYRIS